jgi:AraC family transcriptional regulator
MQEELDSTVASLLVDIKHGIDADLRLETLARAAGTSPFRLHRHFSTTVGETPKRHVARLRLERAARLLATTDQSVLGIGLTVGFASHETFARAFKRAFGSSPTAYRKAVKAAQAERMERNRDFRGACCQLSHVRFEAMPTTALLAIRRPGSYANLAYAAHAGLWDELIAWAQARGITFGAQRLGLFPDDPLMTPPLYQSADLCIPIEGMVEADKRVRCITLSSGLYAMIDHFGPYETLIQAYRALADGVRRSGRYVVREDVRVQVFDTMREGGHPAANRSRVCVPVTRTG